MKDVKTLVFAHLQMYPGMELVDCVKLLYQNELGAGHLLEDAEAFCRRLREELELPELCSRPPQCYTDIGGGICRVHLSAMGTLPCAGTFTRLCAIDAALQQGTAGGLRDKLAVLRAMGEAGELPYKAEAVASFLEGYAKDGFPPVSHSERFRALYSPHYRVMRVQTARYLPVFAAIDSKLAQKPHVLTGIDGMCAAGKSGLSALLAEVYGCGVVHADDFFLQPGQRTAARRAQPGGNVDYERLAPVAKLAADDRAFQYGAYNCETGEMGEVKQVPAGPLTVLEGVYSLSREVNAACDVRIFLCVDADVQAKRVKARNPEMATRFFNEWIPMENRYFVEQAVRESCDVVIVTSDNRG